MLLVRWSLPARSDLEDLYALSRDAKPKIQLRTNVWRRTTPLHEGIQRSTHSRKFYLSERHGRYATFCKLTVFTLKLPDLVLAAGAARRFSPRASLRGPTRIEQRIVFEAGLSRITAPTPRRLTRRGILRDVRRHFA